jgi:hypothetical protein
MALLDEQVYRGYPQMGRRRAMPNTDVEINQGLLRGASYYPYDLLGSPVDLINMALTPLGLGSEKPVMGSAYLQGLAQRAGLSAQPTGSNAENVARLAMSLTNPAAGARAVGRVVEPTVQALAPKAGQALESYMVNQGMIQPLTAYHGTPHTIQGQFDINKVGTGEGSQAFGHGMYFAENPKVAIGYRDALAVDPNVASEKLQFKTLETFMPTEKKAVQGEIQAFLDGTGNYNNFVRVINQEGSDAFKKALLKEEPNLFSAGNLYKVDIPDAYIPTMMDYDKPLGQQSSIVKKALNEIKKQITPEMKMELGGDMNVLFGKDVTPVQFLNTMEIIHPTGGVGIGERMLNEMGVKGIRYLDNASRDTGKGTSNYVVFDPTDVKILEKNNEPIQGLLD